MKVRPPQSRVLVPVFYHTRKPEALAKVRPEAVLRARRREGGWGLNFPLETARVIARILSIAGSAGFAISAVANLRLQLMVRRALGSSAGKGWFKFTGQAFYFERGGATLGFAGLAGMLTFNHGLWARLSLGAFVIGTLIGGIGFLLSPRDG